jgi:HlyB family type I secretion system ABC transporter
LDSIPPPSDQTETASQDPRERLEVRLLALIEAARWHGIDLDRDELRIPSGGTVAPALLVEWVRGTGLWARAAKFSWKHLIATQAAGPIVLLLDDGSAALMVRADPARNIVWLKNPAAAFDDGGVPVDQLRLEQLWKGQVILLRPERGANEDNAPFSFAWVARIVWREKRILRDICIGSVVLSILAILPPLLVMVVVDKVVTYQSGSTLLMLTLILIVGALYETYLGYARRELILVVATRMDTRISLHIFRRLLGLSVDFFEKNQTGAILYKVGQFSRIREFLTGRMLTTVLDLVTLTVLIPFLFWLNAPLTWLTLAAGAMIGVIIFLCLPRIRRIYVKYLQAEVEKSTVMVESVAGIRTVKSLALEPQQREMWDQRTATASLWQQELGRASNVPATLVTPFENFMNRGVLLVGAYFALHGDTASLGSLVAFMMLSGRVASPLVSLARLTEDYEHARAAVGVVAEVLNNRPEVVNPGAGVRPRIEGAVRFHEVDFVYPGTRAKVLQQVSFDIPAGSTLGLVGRSGSGKSTVTRLLQGINREYEGQIKIDGTDLREINLAHLRRSFGVVLQENFLFRGTIRENIIAGRPGLTLNDAIRAARLAGAEEFIERLPLGYETWIEEGSPNLSGGQRQRLAIARALIHDPRILILDEATSALDPESEALVNANIRRIGHGRTMLIVSHRLSSLVECDQILVLDQGKVMDIGPHAVLVERCPVYRTLWMQQNRHMMEPGRGPQPTAIAARNEG